MGACDARYLGTVPYAEALAMQESLVERRKRDEIDDQFLLLEHPHVITLGRAADRSNILVTDASRAELGVELFDTGRGGDVTYHGPGQLVGYPILKLPPGRQDIRRYVRDLQEVLRRTAQDFGVDAEPRGGEFVGLWVGEEKLAAIGIRISRWVTMHGFAFNVSTKLDYFQLIIPCGIRDHGVTSLEKLLGHPVDMGAVVTSAIAHFASVFGSR